MNEQEFANIVREHKSTIYTVCYMFSKNQNEVDDLFQEVLLNLWRGIEHFKGESKLATWIYRISLNTCISADRKKKKHATETLSQQADIYAATDEAETRQIQMLHKRVHRLRPFDRAIVLLWLEGLGSVDF